MKGIGHPLGGYDSALQLSIIPAILDILTVVYEFQLLHLGLSAKA